MSSEKIIHLTLQDLQWQFVCINQTKHEFRCFSEMIFFSSSLNKFITTMSSSKIFYARQQCFDLIMLLTKLKMMEIMLPVFFVWIAAHLSLFYVLEWIFPSLVVCWQWISPFAGCFLPMIFPWLVVFFAMNFALTCCFLAMNFPLACCFLAMNFPLACCFLAMIFVWIPSDPLRPSLSD